MSSRRSTQSRARTLSRRSTTGGTRHTEETTSSLVDRSKSVRLLSARALMLGVHTADSSRHPKNTLIQRIKSRLLTALNQELKCTLLSQHKDVEQESQAETAQAYMLEVRLSQSLGGPAMTRRRFQTSLRQQLSLHQL